jgi:hypothetical protein
VPDVRNTDIARGGWDARPGRGNEPHFLLPKLQQQGINVLRFADMRREVSMEGEQISLNHNSLDPVFNLSLWVVLKLR